MLNLLAGRLVDSLKKAVGAEKSPTIDIKFGVHNHYNNNADSVGDFKHPLSSFMLSEIAIRVTDQGLVIFNLDKRLDIEGKIALAVAVEKSLKEQFGVGLSFATCGSSDCISENELQPFYDSIKTINPNITTIFTSTRFHPEDDWIGCPKDLRVDHFVDQWAHDPDTATIVTGIVNPNGEGKSKSPKEWDTLQQTLEDLFHKAKKHKLSLAKPQATEQNSSADGPV